MARVGVAQVDARSGQLPQINKKDSGLVGYSAEERLDLTVRDLTHPEDLELDRQQRRDLVAGTNVEFTDEKSYLHKMGSVVWIIVPVSPLWGPGEGPSCSLTPRIPGPSRPVPANEFESLLRQGHGLLPGVVEPA